MRITCHDEDKSSLKQYSTALHFQILQYPSQQVATEVLGIAKADWKIGLQLTHLTPLAPKAGEPQRASAKGARLLW